MVNRNRTKSGDILDSLILDIYPLMPSTGSWPFAMSSNERRTLTLLETDKPLFGVSQLLILERTDFNGEDLIDYVIRSKEYQTIPAKKKLEFLDRYHKLAENEHELKNWRDRITSLAIGLITGSALNKGLQLVPISTDLMALNKHIGLDPNKLTVYQLYDVYQLDPSYLV